MRGLWLGAWIGVWLAVWLIGIASFLVIDEGVSVTHRAAACERKRARAVLEAGGRRRANAPRRGKAAC
jgi:UPF0716 family protein affecting phage T7 exclusion